MKTRPHGFTLVELMVVVVIIAITGAIGVTVYQRGARSEQTPGAARALLGTITEARHAALSLGAQTRVRLTVSPRALITEQLLPNTTTWQSIATYQLPGTARLCAPLSGARMAAVSAGSVTCPLAADTTICVAGSGATTLSSDGSCPGGASGATLFLQSETAGEQRFKIAIYGLTGLAKLVASSPGSSTW